MAALPSLRQLRYLLALAEHLNFTRAAEASFVSQSTLSTGLKELESTLGVQLVERDKQTVALTAVGKEVVARARQVLAAAEDLSDFASDASRPMQGQLRLGVIPTIAPFVLPTVMPALREKFPQLQLALREDLTAHLRGLALDLVALQRRLGAVGDGALEDHLHALDPGLLARIDPHRHTAQRHRPGAGRCGGAFRWFDCGAGLDERSAWLLSQQYGEITHAHGLRGEGRNSTLHLLLHRRRLRHARGVAGA